MGLIREPKNVDFTVESKPWTEAELRDFRKLMTELKAKNVKQKVRGLTASLTYVKPGKRLTA